MLKDYPLTSEDYILARYQTILKKQNINTVEDLLFEFPTKYENFKASSIKEATMDTPIVLEGTVASKVSVSYLKSKLTTVTFQLELEDERIRCVIFNRMYLKGKINYGSVVRVQGKFYQTMTNFTVNNIMICDELNRDIIPTYRIKDISYVKYLELLEKCYRRYKSKIEETLPLKLLEEKGLMGLKDAVGVLHFSDDEKEIEKAIKRIKYEELLTYQLSMKYLRYERQLDTNCPIIHYDSSLVENFMTHLPYELTTDQVKTAHEILDDLKSPFAMNRLLQGEVGSGKTIVAITAILATISDGYQAALMCPTEILSKQHFETLTAGLSFYPNFHIALLTGSTPVCQKKAILKGLMDKTINVVVGTHALFQKDVYYANLGLVITDEEHRFGVRQRVLIRNKGLEVNYLKMSATPIPRSLAISCYGDTDLSIIKTMPKNRKPVVTKYVKKEDKKRVLQHMKQELSIGHQIYVVTPLIEESEALDVANANEIYQKMSEYFSKTATVGLIHGRMKAEEKEDVMERFLKNEIQILVATSVIEVGVNVKNATTILVLGSERFGLATLHQLRGRVMRSDAIPYCFFLSENCTEQSDKRLEFLEKTTDGLTLAEYDLSTRGPGEFFGEKQSGEVEFKHADLLKDNELLEQANMDSEKIMEDMSWINNKDYEHLYHIVYYNYLKKTNQID